MPTTCISATRAASKFCAGGCSVAATAIEVSHDPQIARPFAERIKATIAAFRAHFPWGANRRAARGNAIHAYASMVGAMILARAVDDPELSREIITQTRKRLT